MTTHTTDTGTTGVTSASAGFIGTDGLLEHWQGHRRLSRRVIEAFPDAALFTFAVGGMRPFGELAKELLGMALPMVRGVLTDEWAVYAPARQPATKDDVLELWDETTEEMNALWPQIRPERFHERTVAFGQYDGIVNDLVLYAVDNEIHHRGQGYVYLRALGIEPPYFWERE